MCQFGLIHCFESFGRECDIVLEHNILCSFDVFLRVAPNFIARGGKKGTTKYVAEEIEKCTDFAKLNFKRPFDRVKLLYRLIF